MTARIIVSNKEDINDAKIIIDSLRSLRKKNFIMYYVFHDERNAKELNKKTDITIYMNTIPYFRRDIHIYESDYIGFIPDFRKIDLHIERMLKYIDIILCRTVSSQKIMEIVKLRYNYTYIT